MRSLHPTPTQVFILWKIFKENVDPVVKLFHRPTLSRLCFNAATNLDNISKVTEAVLFSIYLASVTSLTQGQVRNLLGEDRDVLVNKYRFAAEQALARAGFLNSSNLMLLQTLVLFLICVRRHDNTRFTWAMSGIAVRIAMVLGVHRDGTNFGLSPFETEMRRRLWWHICLLDIRAAEDHGADPTIIEPLYDTRLPLNVNDADLTPEMTEVPAEREGCTEMTFSLIRFEVCVANRRLNYVPPGSKLCNEKAAALTIEDKEKLIEELHKRLEERYLRHCDMNIPMDWVCSTVGRLVMGKMWLVVHHPLQRADRGKSMSNETRERLFLTSIEVIEFTRLLESNENTAKWGWLFHTYMQWQAVALILTELIVRPPGPIVDRAWRVIDQVYDGWESTAVSQKRGMLWRPMKILIAKALAVRTQQNQAKAAECGWAGQVSGNPTSMAGQVLPTTTMASSPISMFGGAGNSNDALGQAAMAFGLDFDSTKFFEPPSSEFNFNAPIQPQAQGQPQAQSQTQPQPQDMTPAQRNLSDEEINQWLAAEQMRQQTPGYQAGYPDWQGWDQMALDFQGTVGEGQSRMITGIADFF